MTFESGFSTTKFTETLWQNNFNLETYDSIRVVQEVFDYFNNEQQKFPRLLLDLVKVAASSYKGMCLKTQR